MTLTTRIIQDSVVEELLFQLKGALITVEATDIRKLDILRFVFHQQPKPDNKTLLLKAASSMEVDDKHHPR